MFAHQVIEDLKKQEHGKMKAYSEWIASCVVNIKRAQCFHMGEASDVNNSMKSMWGSQLFIDNAKSMKLPYDICWFDATSAKGHQHQRAEEIASKEAVLVSRIIKNSDKYLICFIMSYADKIKSWVLIPLAYLISVGEIFTQETSDELGKILKLNLGKCDDKEGNLKILGLGIDWPNDVMEQQHKMNALNLQLLANSLMLLNCKNIKTEKIIAPPALNKKRRLNGKQEIFDYHVLNVFVPSDKKRGYQDKSIPLSHNRVHLCRGHFKEYTAEHPLFGKYTGLYWWQPSVRGQNKDGIVLKDYNIKATTEE